MRNWGKKGNMKKIILSTILSGLFAYGQTTLTFEDLYGEVQVNSIVANQCLEEITFTRNITGLKCKFYTKTIPSTKVYKRLVKKEFKDFNSQNSIWDENDWNVLKNQMKRLIYIHSIVIQ